MAKQHELLSGKACANGLQASCCPSPRSRGRSQSLYQTKASLEYDGVLSSPHHPPHDPPPCLPILSPTTVRPTVPLLLSSLLRLSRLSLLVSLTISPPLPVRQAYLRDMEKHERLMLGLELDVRDLHVGEA